MDFDALPDTALSPVTLISDDVIPMLIQDVDIKLNITTDLTKATNGEFLKDRIFVIEKALSQAPDREHLDVSAKRRRTASSTSRVAPNSSSPDVTLCMRGLNIQWPFSQLLLMGAKTEEVREYDIGHRMICKADEEVWIVETKGPHAKAMTNAISDGLELAPRPSAAQIVGTVSFSGAFQYRNIEDFVSARERHGIAIGSKYDWDGSGSRFGWQVARVHKLAKPIGVESKSMTGFSPRSFTVEFTDAAVCDDVGAVTHMSFL